MSSIFYQRWLRPTMCLNYKFLRVPQIRHFGQPAPQTHPHLVATGEVTPGITKQEYQLRRTEFMQKIVKYAELFPQTGKHTGYGHIAIIPSAPKCYMSHDIPYPFRQNTDFLYLCGFQEPDSILVLEATERGLPDHTATLFVPKKDPRKELWDGPRSGIDGAMEITGVERAMNMDSFTTYLERYLCDQTKPFVTWYEHLKPKHLEFHAQFIGDFLKAGKQCHIESPRSLIQYLRLRKSPAEIQLMQKTCDIASEAFKEVMKFSHPGVNEHHLYAKMDFECRVNGAEILAYPPVVAGGNRANTIHYVSNNQLVRDGELVLMDAGCECHGYTSDITRTWPVSGVYSPAQRALYEAVLAVQQHCIEFCGKDNVSLEMVLLEMLNSLGQQLQQLGLISPHLEGANLQKAARSFCPHHVGHCLGMDVHDTDEVSRGLPLCPGMVVTVEPGIYIQQSREDVPHEFRGIGIRIEDNILITEKGPHVLSSKCPKHPDEIESLLAER